MTSVEIPSSVESIGVSAFEHVYGLESVALPEGLKTIGDYAFWCSLGLRQITIPASVTSIGYWAFTCCDNMTKILVADGNQNYSAVDGVLFNKDKTTLIYCPGGREGAYEIPSGVTRIGDDAFRDCYYLNSVTIPEGVTSIGRFAFSRCKNLTDITIPFSVDEIGDCAFYCCLQLTEINVADGSQYYSSEDGVLFNQDKTTLISCPAGKEGTYQVPNGVTTLGYSAFSNSKLTGITLPEGLTTIDYDAFERCDRLKSLVFPASVTEIMDCAFYTCDNLSDVYFGGTEDQWAAMTIGEGNDALSGAIIHYNVIPCAAHKTTKVLGRQEATCIEYGYTGTTVCTVCGTIVSAGETIEPLGHDWVQTSY